MTLVLSLGSLIEEATLGGKVKRVSGNVLDPSKLLLEENLRALEEAFGGVFAFLAFHPSADAAVIEYLESGTLESDSGPNVLVLFTQSRNADTPKQLSSEAFTEWLEVRSEQLPAQGLIRGLFEPGYVPPLPGLLVFDSFTEQGEAVYFDLSSDARVEEVRSSLRPIFALVDKAARSRIGRRRAFADRVAVAAQRAKLTHRRSGRVSMRQWLVQAYQLVGEHAGDIVAPLRFG
jgi:hypothetical protein